MSGTAQAHAQLVGAPVPRTTTCGPVADSTSPRAALQPAPVRAASPASPASPGPATVAAPTDAQLLAALVGGGAMADAALRTLFERHAPWLAGRLRRGLPAHAVEDVVQETFLAVWRSANTASAQEQGPGQVSAAHRGQGDVAAWLWGIARRQAALWLRRSLRGGLPVTSTDAELAQLAAPLHLDPALSATQVLDLDAALQLLGPPGSPNRELVQLVLLEERPLAEAAAALQVPTGTVKSRLFRIRQRLRAALGDDTATANNALAGAQEQRQGQAYRQGQGQEK